MKITIFHFLNMVSKPTLELGWGSKENRSALGTTHRGPVVPGGSLYLPHLLWKTSFLCFRFLGDLYGRHIYSDNLLLLGDSLFLLFWKAFRSSPATITFLVTHCPGGPICSSPIFQRVFYAFLATYKSLHQLQGVTLIIWDWLPRNLCTRCKGLHSILWGWLPRNLCTSCKA